MFGQDNQDATNDFFGPAGFGSPAPGSAGPINQDDAQQAARAPVTNPDEVSSAPAVTVAPTQPQGNDELLDIKQEALQQLSPLVGHLEQSPEEKFRTTMMMIQASDDQSLLREAYEAAKQIEDEKTRAQALLDVVNEINYFTQQHHN